MRKNNLLLPAIFPEKNSPQGCWQTRQRRRWSRDHQLKMDVAVNDADYMKRALELARQGRGFTSPNPMVGAVLVKEGRVIAEGYHPRCGDRHAEVVAIENAREPVTGAILYCNLEPCCHDTPHKRTPPCTRRIIQENIARVVIATLDPNPQVSGKGVEMLRSAGIEVQSGVLQQEAALLNEAYFKWIQTGRPLVHLKMAVSLDFCIATRKGHSRWITDEAARRRVHELRAAYDAVLVGAHTARMDDPQLTVRLTRGPQPRRIVLDSTLSLPPQLRLFCDEHRHLTHVFTTPDHDPAARSRLETNGVHIHVLPATAEGQVDLPAALARLGEMNLASLLVEGGSRVFTELIRQRLFDKLSAFVAPLIIGRGIPAIGDLDTETVDQALRLQHMQYQPLNDQIHIQGYRHLAETLGKVMEEPACLPESSKTLAK